MEQPGEIDAGALVETLRRATHGSPDALRVDAIERGLAQADRLADLGQGDVALRTREAWLDLASALLEELARGGSRGAGGREDAAGQGLLGLDWRFAFRG